MLGETPHLSSLHFTSHLLTSTHLTSPFPQVLADEAADRSMKQSAGDKCASLLQSMGRGEELASLLRLMAVLIPESSSPATM
jgi:hypothetical protein